MGKIKRSSTHQGHYPFPKGEQLTLALEHKLGTSMNGGFRTTIDLAQRLVAILQEKGTLPLSAAKGALRQRYPTIMDEQIVAAIALAVARGDLVRRFGGAALARKIRTS